jgi:hypothetical protein
MTDRLQQILAPIKERIEKATKGPWYRTTHVWRHKGRDLILEKIYSSAVPSDERCDLLEDVSVENANPIAAAPTDLARLVRIVEIQNKTIDVLWAYYLGNSGGFGSKGVVDTYKSLEAELSRE